MFRFGHKGNKRVTLTITITFEHLNPLTCGELVEPTCGELVEPTTSTQIEPKAQKKRGAGQSTCTSAAFKKYLVGASYFNVLPFGRILEHPKG